MKRVRRVIMPIFWALLLTLASLVFWLWWGVDDLRHTATAPAKPVADSASATLAERLPQPGTGAFAAASGESPSTWACAKAQARIKQLEFAKDILNFYVGTTVTRFPREIQSRVDAEIPIYAPYENHDQAALEIKAAQGDAKAAAVAGIRINLNGFPRYFSGLPERPTRDEQLALEEKAEVMLRQAITAGVTGLLNEYTDLLHRRAWRLSPRPNNGLAQPGYEEAQARYVAMVQLSFEYDDLYGAFQISMEKEQLDRGDGDAGDPVLVSKYIQEFQQRFSPGLLVDWSVEERKARDWLRSLVAGVPEIEELKALRRWCAKNS